jgi:hypothetical protein
MKGYGYGFTQGVSYPFHILQRVSQLSNSRGQNKQLQEHVAETFFWEESTPAQAPLLPTPP